MTLLSSGNGMAYVECQESVKFAHDLRCTDGHKLFLNRALGALLDILLISGYYK